MLPDEVPAQVTMLGREWFATLGEPIYGAFSNDDMPIVEDMNIIPLKAALHKTSENTTGLALFTCRGTTVGLMWLKRQLYIFDSHIRGPTGMMSSNGTSMLLKFSNTDKAE